MNEEQAKRLRDLYREMGYKADHLKLNAGNFVVTVFSKTDPNVSTIFGINVINQRVKFENGKYVNRNNVTIWLT